MRVSKLILGKCSTNVYIVASDQNNAVLIDPADETEAIIKAVEDSGLILKYIFITHGHTDHILALEAIKNHFHAPIVISREDAWRLEDEELINERPYVTVPYKAVKPDILIESGDTIEVDELTFSFYGMPGHTPGSMAIAVEDAIFTGDTLLFENHGKTTLPGGNEEELIDSINRMLTDFKGNYHVYPGHRQETDLEHERLHNPFVIKHEQQY